MINSKEFEKNILLCGVGGQGTVLASKLIAATAMRQNLKVYSAETIGMAQRGGSVTSHIRIGEKAYSPLLPKGSADVIMAFEPAEAVRNLAYLKKDGLVIVNSIPVKPVTESLVNTGYDGTEMIEYLKKNCNCIVADAEELCKGYSLKFLNIAMLGILIGTGITGLEEKEVIEEIKAKIKPDFVDSNIEVLKRGIIYNQN